MGQERQFLKKVEGFDKQHNLKEINARPRVKQQKPKVKTQQKERKAEPKRKRSTPKKFDDFV